MSTVAGMELLARQEALKNAEKINATKIEKSGKEIESTREKKGQRKTSKTQETQPQA